MPSLKKWHQKRPLECGKILCASCKLSHLSAVSSYAISKEMASKEAIGIGEIS
jgi:hypothetical protein